MSEKSKPEENYRANLLAIKFLQNLHEATLTVFQAITIWSE